MTSAALVRVVPKTMYDFGYLPASTTDSIVVARAVNVIPYSVAYLWVRVYQLHIGSGSSVNVIATSALPADDTQQTFKASAAAATLSLTGSAPLLLTAALTTPIGPYLQIEVQGSFSGATTNLGAEISIDLLVRSCT